jgi:plasmid stabilization system protein ParE
MTATVEFSDDARRMLDDADERWAAEHGYLAANPLVEEAEHATELLRHNPELGVRFRRARAAGLRSGACGFKQAGTSTTASTPAGPMY